MFSGYDSFDIHLEFKPFVLQRYIVIVVPILIFISNFLPAMTRNLSIEFGATHCFLPQSSKNKLVSLFWGRLCQKRVKYPVELVLMSYEGYMPRARDCDFFVAATLLGIGIKKRSDLLHHRLGRVHI